MEKKYKKILFDLADSVSINEEAAKSYLQEQGINVSIYAAKAIKEIRRQEFLRKAEENLGKHQEQIAKAIIKIRNVIPEALISIEETIKRRNPAFQFRNLKELDEQQLREILEDVELINAIEKLEKSEEE